MSTASPDEKDELLRAVLDVQMRIGVLRLEAAMHARLAKRAATVKETVTVPTGGTLTATTRTFTQVQPWGEPQHWERLDLALANAERAASGLANLLFAEDMA